MGNANVHARMPLLHAWEAYRSQVLTAQNASGYYFAYGGLLAISRILDECRHEGNGKDYIKAGEWVVEAVKIGSKAFLDLRLHELQRGT